MRLLAGNTGYGIYKDWPDEDVIINVNAIPDLHNLQCTQVLPCPAAVIPALRQQAIDFLCL